MKMKPFGKTELEVSEFGFGALPIQRTEQDEAVKILRRAYSAGVNFYDTARGYTDSEQKLGLAFEGVRENIIIATKTHAHNLESLKKDLESSLASLKTDYIDIYQFHNPDFKFEGENAEGMLDYVRGLKKQGVVRHIGVTAHKYGLALDHIKRGVFESLQYPISMLSGEKDFEVINAARAAGMGIIAMKALSGGLITNARAATGWMMQNPDIQPIWGIQRMSELEEFITLYKEGVALDGELNALIESEKRELSGSFCRGCGYCMPCPVGLPINMFARLPFMLRRSPTVRQMTDEYAAEVEKINNCTSCGLCRSRCPYELDCPELMREALVDYRELYARHKSGQSI
jgi:predicted aldo/keto reductase-like oxidoreductase